MFHSCFVMLVLCVTLHAAVDPTQSEQIIVPLSRPGEPGSLSVGHYKGSITVTGHNGKSVIISGAYRQKETTEARLQVSNASIRLGATEKDNRIIVDTHPSRRTIDLEIKVPRAFSLHLSTHDNGQITVHDVSGDFEINNVNGDIQLDGVSGSAVLYTVEGNLDIQFIHITENMPMVFTSVEGKIDVTFPADAGALLKMKTDHGEIFHDSGLHIEWRSPKVKRDDPTRSTRITLDDWSYGRLGNGGPDILIKTVNGDIFIRRIE